MHQRYFGAWSNLKSLLEWFTPGYNPKDSKTGLPANHEVLIASSGGIGRDGFSVVIFRRRGQIWINYQPNYLIKGGHGEWRPEPYSRLQLNQMVFILEGHHPKAIALMKKLGRTKL